MTTLQLIGAKLALCLPKLKHYGLLLGLCIFYVLTTALSPTEFSTDNPDTEPSEKSTIEMYFDAMMGQVIRIPVTSIIDTVKIENCGEQISFESDSTATGQYIDSPARNSVTVICPETSDQFLKVHFSEFDLAAGDVLSAFDGLNTSSPFIGSGSGVGVSQMNGGWLVSNCDKIINPSGCIAFQFQTTDDNNKSTGWNSWITCEDRSMLITPPSNQFITLKCSEIKHAATITAGHIISNCGLSNDSLLVEIVNARGRVCMDTCIRADSSFVIDTLAMGKYTIRHTLKIMPTITTKNYLIISPPAITCNDDVEAVLGAACMAAIRPDMILENNCDTTDYLYYNIVIKTESGRIIKSGTSRNGAYPIITRDDVDVCSNTRYQVEITRVYNYDGTCCSEGLIKDVCWGYISFIDGSKPFFTSSSIDTISACKIDFEKITPILTKPDVIDNCDSVSLKVIGHELINGDECTDIRTYLITWEATDRCGKSATQKDTLRVLRPQIENIIKLPNIVLSCGEDTTGIMNDYDRLGSIKIVTLGDTLTLSTEEYICNYILIKNDEVVPHPGGQKIARYWAIVDACSGQPIPIMIDTQIVDFLDTLAPSIDCSPYNTLTKAQTIGLPAHECTMIVALPKPTATDVCEEPDVEMFSVAQLKNGEWKEIAANLKEAGELPCDTFRVGWQAIDKNIYNSLRDTCFQYFRLEDVTPPSAICKDEYNVAFSTDGTRIYASELDNKSTDECGVLKIEIRRDSGEWAEYIDFTCSDVHKTIPAALRMTDKGGNTNTCSVRIIVQDLIPPHCADLSDFKGTCDDYINDQLGLSTDLDEDYIMEEEEWVDLRGDLLEEYNNKFGNPKCEDNLACVEFSSEQQYQVHYSQCGEIKARRRYRITDWNGEGLSSSWKYQDINITYKPGWTVTLPVDFYGECGDDIPDPGLIINNETCDLIAWEHEDKVFDIVADACFKVVRTYYIINWCNYVQGQEPIEISREENVLGLVYDAKTITHEDVANYGYFTYTQVLKVTDHTAPTVSINNVETCIVGVGDVAPFGVEDQTPGAAPFECDTIRIFSAEARDCEKSGFKNFSFSYEVYEDGELAGSGDGSKFFWVVRPKVIYTIRFTTYDNCGNEGTATKEFQFWDCSRPVVSCISTFNSEVSEDSVSTIDAAALDKGSFDNCTPKYRLRYKVWHHSYSLTPPTTKEGVAALPNAIHLSCQYRDIQTVYFYVLDEEDNFDFCISKVNVQNNLGICTGEPVSSESLIAGNIQTIAGTMVEGVNIKVEGTGNMPNPTLTGANGNFAFNLNKGQSYKVVAENNNQPLNGVTTFDLILISKHILGIKSFDSPYKYIAADVNKSGTITAFDLVQLRRLILNIISEFPDNESWRFVDAKHNFTNANSLLDNFKEIIEINNHQIDKMDADFVAIKIGDLNGSAKVNALQTTEARTTNKKLNFDIKDKELQVGETITIDFKKDDLQKINGYQFALAFNGLELLEIKEGLVKSHHFGHALIERGILLNSWDYLNDPTEQSNQTQYLFSLEFRALRAGKLSEFLHLQPNVLQTEAYSTTGEIIDINLHFEKTNTTLRLEQNRPNPFKETTEIGFQLPKAGKVTLTILDLQGRILQRQEDHFSKGYHEWKIEGQSLTTKGILYYQLATDNEVLTKKMMVIE